MHTEKNKLQFVQTLNVCACDARANARSGWRAKTFRRAMGEEGGSAPQTIFIHLSAAATMRQKMTGPIQPTPPRSFGASDPA